MSNSEFRTYAGNSSFAFSLLAEQLIPACKLYSSQESLSERLSLLNPGEIQRAIQFVKANGVTYQLQPDGIF